MSLVIKSVTKFLPGQNITVTVGKDGVTRIANSFEGNRDSVVISYDGTIFHRLFNPDWVEYKEEE